MTSKGNSCALPPPFGGDGADLLSQSTLQKLGAGIPHLWGMYGPLNTTLVTEDEIKKGNTRG